MPRVRRHWRSIIGAPEHPFPAAVDDAVAGYRFLLAKGIQAGGITIAGDSAGGGLAVAAMLAIRDAGLPQPGCGWAISPWVDMEAIGESMTAKAATDPTVQQAGILDMAKHYLGGADPRSPLAAPIYADLAGLRSTAHPSGRGGDIAGRCGSFGAGGGRCRCRGRSADLAGMIHVWHVYHPQLSAGRRAIETGGQFARAMTSRGSRTGF